MAYAPIALLTFAAVRIDTKPFVGEAGVLETVWQDVRYGIRLLRRSPLFTLTAALSLAIGIGANTTIFSVASALLLRPLPGIAEPGRLVDIGRTRNGKDFDNSSYPNYRDVRARVTTLSDVYAYRLEPQAIASAGRTAPSGSTAPSSAATTSPSSARRGARRPPAHRRRRRGRARQPSGDRAQLRAVAAALRRQAGGDRPGRSRSTAIPSPSSGSRRRHSRGRRCCATRRGSRSRRRRWRRPAAAPAC